jgi:hypothetical protein
VAADDGSRPAAAHLCGPLRIALMAKERGTTPSRRRGGHGPLVTKRTADRRTKALAAIIREIRRAGYTTHRDISEELNRLGVPAAGGGEWNITTVARLLARLG